MCTQHQTSMKPMVDHNSILPTLTIAQYRRSVHLGADLCMSHLPLHTCSRYHSHMIMVPISRLSLPPKIISVSYVCCMQVGMIACNDYILLECCMFRILKQHFASSPSYVKLLDLFHEVRPMHAYSTPCIQQYTAAATQQYSSVQFCQLLKGITVFHTTCIHLAVHVMHCPLRIMPSSADPRTLTAVCPPAVAVASVLLIWFHAINYC